MRPFLNKRANMLSSILSTGRTTAISCSGTIRLCCIKLQALVPTRASTGVTCVGRLPRTLANSVGVRMKLEPLGEPVCQEVLLPRGRMSPRKAEIDSAVFNIPCLSYLSLASRHTEEQLKCQECIISTQQELKLTVLLRRTPNRGC